MNAAQIAQELKTLEAKNKACAEQLRELYQRYLAELSHSASQQLMAVCYHLCTESYPEAFLGLSVKERQILQEKVRRQGDKLRQQLSLDKLLLPDPGDMEEASQPRIAVIKAELTGDDLEVITSALDDDNGDRILALLKEKEVDLPFDIETLMKQRRRLKADDSVAESEKLDGAERSKEVSPQLPTSSLSTPEVDDLTPGSEAQPGKALEERAEEDAKDSPVDGLELDAGATADSTLSSEAPLMEGYSSVPASKSRDSRAIAEEDRSLGQRFLAGILPGRGLERRMGHEDGASMSGEGSLQVGAKPSSSGADTAVENHAGEGQIVEGETAEGQAAEAKALEARIPGGDSEEGEVAGGELEGLADADLQDGFELESFDDNNGFDPNFEPPPAEDRYEPTPLKASDKLDISPGVLASALASEGEDDKGGMLMRPISYDGTTELSEEALRDPFALIRWVERMERGISQRLRQSSQRMTRSLEKSHILNNELPDGLLEAAVRPDGDHEDDSDRKMPHVLSLRLNAAGKDNRPRRDKSIRIVAIYLRLSEIEFETPAVMAWRNQLRSQVKQLRRLSNEYKDCKHAQSVVEAQELWNSGWKKD